MAINVYPLRNTYKDLGAVKEKGKPVYWQLFNGEEVTVL